MSPQRVETAQAKRPMGIGAVVAALFDSARTAPDPESFCRLAAATIGGHFHSPFVSISIASAGRTVEVAHHCGPTHPDFWRPAVHRFLLEALAHGRPVAHRFSARSADLQVAFLFAPFINGQEDATGGIALVYEGRDPDEIVTALSELDAAAGTLHEAFRTLGTAPHASARSGDPDWLDALGRSGRYHSQRQLAFAITNNLRNRTNCDSAALGVVTGGRVRLLSVAGFDETPANSPGSQRLLAAMGECLDASRTLAVQDAGQWAEAADSTGHRLHRAWAEQLGSAAVLSVPLTHDGRTEAILSLARRADHPFSKEDVAKIESLVLPFAPGLSLLRRAGRSLIRHALDRAGETARAMTRPRGMVASIAALVALGTLAWCVFGVMPYRVKASATVSAASELHYACPYDAILADAPLAAGDRVLADQVLYRLDTTELELERDRLLAEIAVARIAVDQALGDPQDRSAVRLAEAELAVLETHLAEVERRIAVASPRAPADGVILTGDLRRSIGQVLPRGTPLLVFASDDSRRVVLRIDEREIDSIAVGHAVRFTPHSDPDVTLEARITRLSPAAQPHGRAIVFLAEADLDPSPPSDPADAPPTLRPGAEGLASVDTGPRPIWWVALHRGIEWARLNLWL